MASYTLSGRRGCLEALVNVDPGPMKNFTSFNSTSTSGIFELSAFLEFVGHPSRRDLFARRRVVASYSDASSSIVTLSG